MKSPFSPQRNRRKGISLLVLGHSSEVFQNGDRISCMNTQRSALSSPLGYTFLNLNIYLFSMPVNDILSNHILKAITC